MQNFKGTEWEGLTEEEIFLLHQKLVKATIRRRFPNNQSFCKTHMIEIDDLIQLGNLGLLNAIRTFEQEEASSFRSYAINSIAWNISAYARKESLRTVNTQTYKLVNVVSVEDKISENEEIAILDIIEGKENTREVAEENVFLQSAIEFLKADKDIDEELLYIIVARVNGETMQNIANHFGTHRNAIIQRLKTQKAMRVKNRLMSYLKNGDC